MSNPIFNEEYRSKIYVISGLVIVFWVIEVINLLMGNSLNAYGIMPREVSGLMGILFAPFLHGGIGHITANTFPFLIMGGLTILRGISFFFKMSLFIIITSGIGVWIIGTTGFHIGASALIFGYFGYLVARAFIERNRKTAMIAIIVGVSFGSMVFGIFPGMPGVSWEGHLTGFIAGIIAAWLFKPTEG